MTAKVSSEARSSTRRKAGVALWSVFGAVVTGCPPFVFVRANHARPACSNDAQRRRTEAELRATACRRVLAAFRRLGVSEQGEHRQHAAVVVLALGQVELLEDALHVPLDGARAEIEPLADRPVRAALGDEREHVALALVELVDHRAMAADEALDDLRIECGATRGDA